MAKRTVIRRLPDGSTEIKTTGCLGNALGWLVGIALLIYAVVGPAENYPWWEAMLTYLGEAALLALVIWLYLRHKRQQGEHGSPPPAQAPPQNNPS